MREYPEASVQLTLATVDEKGGRPWEPFKRIPIRLFGNNKTTKADQSGKAWGRRNVTSLGNCLDPVRGCSGGKTNAGFGCPWGCYSKESVRRYHRNFDTPVSMTLRPKLLESDLSRLDENWIRIGVAGDPCFDWPLTCTVCEICSARGKTPVVLSRFWRTPDEQTLQRLAASGIVLHGSICALDSERQRSRILDSLLSYSKLGGHAVIRLVSFAFPSGSALWEIQDDLAHRSSLPVLEQPGRLMGTNPTFALVGQSCYTFYRSNITGQVLKRWRSAGQVYPELAGCVTHCWECSHRCMTREG